jgi:hypothetical protein
LIAEHGHRPRALRLFSIGCVLLVGGTVAGMAQQAGRDPAPGQPLPGETTFIDREHPVTASGTLDEWRAVSTQGARVMLKVYRPDGDRLLLVGTSPLETVAAGEVMTFTCRIPVARNDLIGCFCPDSSCVDAFAAGETLSATGDLGTSPTATFTTGVGTPAIFAAGLLLADVPSTAATDLVVPVVARTPGLNGTIWSTSLEIHNTGDQIASAALFFNRSGSDNTTPAASAQVEIPANETLVIDDLLDEAFALADDAGSLDIISSEPVFAHARIANDGGAAGSFGQSAPAVPAAWALGRDDVPGTNPDAGTATLFECREDADFRCNLGVASVANLPLIVDVTAWSGADPVGTPLTLDIEPFSHIQVNRILQTMGVAVTRGVRLEVAAAPGSDGRFFAYISKIDNQSGDAVFLLGDHEPTHP